MRLAQMEINPGGTFELVSTTVVPTCVITIVWLMAHRNGSVIHC
ncbi:hypothetical protein ACULNC_19540 [Shigella flexneri]